jgi:hypothetical protein
MTDLMPKPCPEWAELLITQHLDDSSSTDVVALKKHLLVCPGCHATHVAYQAVSTQLRSLPLMAPQRQLSADMLLDNTNPHSNGQFSKRESQSQTGTARMRLVPPSDKEALGGKEKLHTPTFSPSFIWQNILSVFIGAFMLTALEGIVGNRADTFFTLIWPSIQSMAVANWLSWFTVTLVLLCCIVICVYFILRSKKFEHAFTTGRKMLSLDDTLLRGLASWRPSLSTEKEMKHIITSLLLDAIAQFDGDVHRAALLLPDASEEYLCCWASYQMPQESVDNMKFYIGPDQSRRQRESGVAGEVFLTGELQVGHLRKVNRGTWVCEDHHSYVKLSRRRSSPAYLSFANVPITDIDHQSSLSTCLGVICFDSMSRDVFDSSANQVVLRTIARRITAALLIFKLYQNLGSGSLGNDQPSRSEHPLGEEKNDLIPADRSLGGHFQHPPAASLAKSLAELLRTG